MEAWTEFTLATVSEALPTHVQYQYDQWVGNNPDREGRLEALISETLLNFRMAVSSNPANETAPSEDVIPITGYRHALNMLLFTLTMEMGIELIPEAYSLMARADIWLRQVQRGLVAPVPQTGHGSNPSYGVKVSEPRKVDWL